MCWKLVGEEGKVENWEFCCCWDLLRFDFSFIIFHSSISKAQQRNSRGLPSNRHWE